MCVLGEITKGVSMCVLEEITKREIRFDWGTADLYWGNAPGIWLLTSDMCSASFSPLCLAFSKAGSRSLPWPTFWRENCFSLFQTLVCVSVGTLSVVLTVGSPLRSSPTTKPLVDSMKSSASLTVSIATSVPFLRSTATRNLRKET